MTTKNDKYAEAAESEIEQTDGQNSANYEGEPDPSTPSARSEPEDVEEKGRQTLDELVAALGQSDESEEVGSKVQLADQIPTDPEDDIDQAEGEVSPRMVSIVESLLFVADRPLGVREIRKVLKEPSKNQVQLAIRSLIATTQERGVRLAKVAGGFCFRTHPENAQWVQKMLAAKPVRLSRAQLESLAIVAYRQPITKPEVDDVRGVDSGAVLKLLLERDLIQIVGRKEEPGRPQLYGTTVYFLEFFNLNSLRDLPDLQEFKQLDDGHLDTVRKQFGEQTTNNEQETMGQETIDLSVSESEEQSETKAEPESETEVEIESS